MVGNVSRSEDGFVCLWHAHDRHIAFNERCWLVGSSHKDAGKKAFHTTEIVDAKAEVVAALEAKWDAGLLYP